MDESMTPGAVYAKGCVPAIVLWSANRQMYEVIAFHMPDTWQPTPITSEQFQQFLNGLPHVNAEITGFWDDSDE